MQIKPTFAAVLALCATLAQAQTEPLVQREFSDRNSRFIEWTNPSGAAAAFRAKAGAHSIIFDASGVTVQSPQTDSNNAKLKSIGVHPGLSYAFEGGSGTAPQGEKPSATQYNWLVGSQAEWRTQLRSFGGLVYRKVWSGIDAVFSGNAEGFKYQFELEAGAKPSQVALRISGAQSMRVTADGAMVWTLNGTTFRDEAPLAFQTVNGKRVLVPAEYKVEQIDARTWRIGFTLGEYNTQLPLVIDPLWVGASGLVGGSSDDVVNAVVRDAAQNTWACGTTSSVDPSTQGLSNAFVVRFDNSGAPSAVTYLGGNGEDTCRAMALDAAGNIYIAGKSDSTNFKQGEFTGDSANFHASKQGTGNSNAYVAKLNPNGTTPAITWLGFIGESGDAQANALALDQAGRVYLTGSTTCVGTCLPVLSGAGSVSSTPAGNRNAFAARVAANGQSLEYIGLIGGDGHTNIGNAIAVDPATNAAVIVGETNSSTGLPTLTGGLRTTPNDRPTADDLPGDAADAFAARINPTGTALERFTLLSGSNNGTAYDSDRAFAVLLLPDGSTLVGGETSAPNFPSNDAGTQIGAKDSIALNGGTDGFLVRLSSDFSTAQYARYVGGPGYDSVEALAMAGDSYYVLGNATAKVNNTPPATTTTSLPQNPTGMQNGLLAKFFTATDKIDFAGYLGNGLGSGFSAIDVRIADIDPVNRPGGRAIVSVGGAQAESAGAPSSGKMLRIDPFGPPQQLLAQDGTDAQSAPIDPTYNDDREGFKDLRLLAVDELGQPIPRLVVDYEVKPNTNGASIKSGVTLQATTDVDGYAVLKGIKANGTAGDYQIIATASGKSVTFNLTNLKGHQAALTASSALNPIPYQQSSQLTVGGGTVTGSNLLQYAVKSGSDACSVSATGKVMALLANKTCEITVKNIGDANYEAVEKDIALTTTLGTQTDINVTASPATLAVGGTSVLSASGGQTSADATFSVDAGSQNVCEMVQGSTNQVTAKTVGTCKVTANLPANDNYASAAKSWDITVTKGSLAGLNVNASKSPLVFGESATLSTDATSSTGAVSYQVSGPCSIDNGNELVTQGAGNCLVTATQAADDNYAQATGTLSVTVEQATQAALQITPVTGMKPGDSVTLATSGGTTNSAVVFSLKSTNPAGACSLAGAQLTAVSAGSCVIGAYMPGNNDYKQVDAADYPVNVSLKAQDALTVNVGGASSIGIALNATATVSTSGGNGTGAITYALKSGSNFCDLSPSTGVVTGKAVGRCEVTATKAAADGYDTATSSNSVSIDVGKGQQTITFTLPAGPMVLIAPDATLSATTDAPGLTVNTFTSKTTKVCEVSGSALKFYTTGTCTVTASQSGDASYASAEKDASVEVTLPAGTASTVTGSITEGTVTAEIIGGDGWVFGPQNATGWEVTGFFPLTSEQPPSNLEFPAGLFGFTAINGPKGTAVEIKLTYPISFPKNAEYWKFGKTRDNQTAHWYKLPGAVITGNTVTFKVTDGGTGDNDLDINSVIKDPGGVAINKAAPVAGATTPVPTLGDAARSLLALMLAGAAALVFRRQRR